MNRIISILITAAMLCSQCCFAAEAEDGSPFCREVEIVKSLGLIDDLKDDAESDFVTRIEFAAILAKLLKVETAKKQIYADVPEMSEYSAYVAALADMGIISKDDKFRPNEYITAAEAIKMTVCALGYKINAENYGGYPTGYFVCAARIGLYSGMSDYGEAMTVGDLGKLLYSLFDVDVLEAEVIGSVNSYTASDGETLIKRSYGITRDEGILAENRLTTLTQPKRDKDNYAAVDGRRYKLADGLDIDDFLGREAEFFVKDTGNTEVLVYLTDSEDKSNIKEFDLSDVTVSGKNIEYTVGNKTKNIKLSKDADYIYNYIADAGYDISSLPSDGGRVRFIDNNGDNLFDVVSVVYYEDKIYQSGSEYFGKISFSDKTFVDLTDAAYDIVDSDGVKTDVSALRDGDILSVAAAKNSKYFKITVCDDVAAGMAESMQTENGHKIITVDGKNYRLSKDFSKYTKDIKLGEYYVIYLNCSGECVFADNKMISTRRYGYLLDSIVSENINRSVNFKIMDDGGKINVLTGAKYMTYNGTNKYSGADVYNMLEKTQDGEIKKQLIVYKENSKGEIFFIETAGSAGDNSLKLAAELNASNSRYVSEQNSFFLNYGVDDNTKIFVVTADNGGDDDEENMKVIGASDLVNNKYYTGAKIYDTDDVNIAGAVVIPSDAEYIYSDNVMLVSNVLSAVNGSGDETSLIKGLYCGETKKFYVSPHYSQTLAPQLADMSRGDILKVFLNDKGEIIKIETLYSVKNSDRDNLYDSSLSQLYRLTIGYYAYGSVMSRKDDFIKVSLAADGTDSALFKLDDGTNIYVYDSENDSVFKGDSSLLEEYGESFMSGRQRVFIKFRYDVIYDLIILT